MSYDNLTKILAEKYPERFATWLLGAPQTNVEILKTELSIEPIRADSLTFLKTHNRILHLEFQTRWISEPPINFRMLDYWVRLYRLYQMPITQIVILLLPPSEDTEIETTFEFEQTRHQYRVVKIWEEDPSLFLADSALLPFATLTAQPTEELLVQVASEVGKMEPEVRRQELSSYVQIMAGLRFNKTLVKRLFREDIMKESVIYQEIFETGEQQGEQRALQREKALILRQVARQVGEVPQDLRSSVELLSIDRLEALGEALLDFNSLQDLQNWLEMA
ncbi:Rpn family recombination-promoting nuclease/putative transposase [Chamaesiphon sp. VAR_69_metabat_338]|uniref:Rpn family recombination-promoting nuclease/putative transposase n=1 Tax=Chamaesiphon sp. VAR_69_metabat_338 TaxID=2964704 RepID=UPI00286E6B28|nr:Rpn family recombination-promoting nuclease/putative transposase [Chamaesiphon sp. VAR_69_metabat_338]